MSNMYSDRPAGNGRLEKLCHNRAGLFADWIYMPTSSV